MFSKNCPPWLLSWVALHGMAYSFLSETGLWSKWSVFRNCSFCSVCPLMDKDKRLVEASSWEGLTVGKSVSCSDGWGHVQFSPLVMSDSLRPHGLQHARPPCPSPTPGVYSNSCPLSQWCHPTISSSVVLFSSRLQSFPASGSFPVSQLFAFRWLKYWSFSFNISPSNEYSGLISFRMDWLDLLEVQGTLKSLLQYHSSKASILQCSAFLYSPAPTSIHDCWKNHSLDKMDLCWQSNVSALSS